MTPALNLFQSGFGLFDGLDHPATEKSPLTKYFAIDLYTCVTGKESAEEAEETFQLGL